jgi:tetratricopeptide (TPR) repeat protein
VASTRPNDAEAIFAVALIERRKGDLKESAAQMERAAELDPKNLEVLANLADTYDGMRMPDPARATYEARIGGAQRSFGRGRNGCVEPALPRRSARGAPAALARE